MVIRLFECFAGYGGASWGLKLASIPYELIGFSEIKKHAIKCYINNFPNAKNYGDITKIDWTQVPDFDLLTGGFPCQDVSTQGKQDLTVGRTVLIDELIKALKIKQPKYFLFENVTGIQANKFKEFLRKIRLDLQAVGYQVFFNELQSCNYGTPNFRTRVWFIGYRKDLVKEFGFVPYPNPKDEFLVIDDILENQDFSVKLDGVYDENQNFVDINKVFWNKRRVKQIIDLVQYKKNVFVSAHATIVTNGISRTLLCGSDFVFFKNGFYRKPTEKELFRIQGFLEDEINLVNLSFGQCMDLAGDGWDVNLVKQIYLKMELV